MGYEEGEANIKAIRLRKTGRIRRGGGGKRQRGRKTEEEKEEGDRWIKV